LLRYEPDDLVQATIAQRELDVERSALERAMTRYGELQVTSNTKGVFIVPRAEDLTGQFRKRGELLGYVVAPSARIARVVVSQDDVGLVREHLRSAEIRVASDISRVFPAKLVREVPAGSNTFPSEALTLAGGGSLAADRRDPNNPKALNRLFQFDVELPSDAIASDAIGAHVWVRFYHGTEPLAFQWWRRARQLFLSRFNA
jgi:putative peptide zinc metalloprotease protein